MRRGRRNAFVYVILGLLCFTAACSMSTEDEDKTREEAIIAQAIEQAELVNSYEIEGGVFNDITWEDGRMEYTYYLFSAFETSEPQRTHAHLEEKQGNGDTEITLNTEEIYEKGEDIYVNSDGEGWKKTSNSANYEYEMTEHEVAIRLLDRIENLEGVNVEKTDETYDFSYYEADETIYDIYKPTSSETVKGTTFVETGSPEVFLAIDETDYTVREYTIKFFYEDQAGGKAENVLTVEYRFDNINEIEDIEIPAEVIKEAEQNE
ncbi:hypothetical protein J26TS2_25330 [Shouchella clausii]|nr:hypothetical protein J26TS2_25330 [Shouchella clausii]